MSPGDTLTLRVTYSASMPQAAAMQWAIGWSLTTSVPTSAVAGTAGTAAGKTLYTATTSPIALLLGLNATVIGGGEVARYTLTVPAIQARQITFSLRDTLGATPHLQSTEQKNASTQSWRN